MIEVWKNKCFGVMMGWMAELLYAWWARRHSRGPLLHARLMGRSSCIVLAEQLDAQDKVAAVARPAWNNNAQVVIAEEAVQQPAHRGDGTRPRGGSIQHFQRLSRSARIVLLLQIPRSVAYL
jgi:hypothetical protein